MSELMFEKPLTSFKVYTCQVLFYITTRGEEVGMKN